MLSYFRLLNDEFYKKFIGNASVRCILNYCGQSVSIFYNRYTDSSARDRSVLAFEPSDMKMPHFYPSLRPQLVSILFVSV